MIFLLKSILYISLKKLDIVYNLIFLMANE